MSAIKGQILPEVTSTSKSGGDKAQSGNDSSLPSIQSKKKARDARELAMEMLKNDKKQKMDFFKLIENQHVERYKQDIPVKNYYQKFCDSKPWSERYWQLKKEKEKEEALQKLKEAQKQQREEEEKALEPAMLKKMTTLRAKQQLDKPQKRRATESIHSFVAQQQILMKKEVDQHL